jgi:hypothetical protein
MVIALLSNGSVNKQQQGNYFLFGPRRAKALSIRKSVARQRSSKTIHPQQWETVFSAGFVKRNYLKNKRRYDSFLSSEFSVEDSHGNFIVCRVGVQLEHFIHV